MNWYTGNIADAVAVSKKNGAVFVVYVEGTDEMSAKLTKFLDDERVRGKLNSKNFVGIKIIGNSQTHEQFRNIYCVVPVPSIYFIGKAGKPLAICTGALESVDELLLNIDSVLKIHGTTIKSSPVVSTEHQSDASSDFIAAEKSDDIHQKKNDVPTTSAAAMAAKMISTENSNVFIRNAAGAEETNGSDQNAASQNPRNPLDEQTLPVNPAAVAALNAAANILTNPGQVLPPANLSASLQEPNAPPPQKATSTAYPTPNPVGASTIVAPNSDISPPANAPLSARRVASQATNLPVTNTLGTSGVRTTISRLIDRPVPTSEVNAYLPMIQTSTATTAATSATTAATSATTTPTTATTTPIAASKSAPLKLSPSPDTTTTVSHPTTSTINEPISSSGTTPPTTTSSNAPAAQSSNLGAINSPSLLSRSQERVAQVEKVLEEKRVAKDEPDNEVRRRRETQNWQREEELKNLQDNLRRDRLADQEARERIRAQIAADRAEHANQRLYGAETPATGITPSSHLTPQGSISSNVEETRLQFRLPGGIQKTRTFHCRESLAAVREYVRSELLSSGTHEFTLATNYPRREFALDDDLKTLTELNLVPNAIVLVIMKESTNTIVRNGDRVVHFMATVVWALLTPAAKAIDYVQKEGIQRLLQNLNRRIRSIVWQTDGTNEVVLVQGDGTATRNMSIFVSTPHNINTRSPPQTTVHDTITHDTQNTPVATNISSAQTPLPVPPHGPQSAPPGSLPKDFQQPKHNYGGETNIHRLSDNTNNKDDDKATYNGNSTQQQ